jgi:hypothetical protein
MAKRKIASESHTDRVTDVMDDALDIAFTFRPHVDGAELDKLIKLISELGVLATSAESLQVNVNPPPSPSSAEWPGRRHGSR